MSQRKNASLAQLFVEQAVAAAHTKFGKGVAYLAATSGRTPESGSLVIDMNPDRQGGAEVKLIDELLVVVLSFGKDKSGDHKDRLIVRLDNARQFTDQMFSQLKRLFESTQIPRDTHGMTLEFLKSTGKKLKHKDHQFQVTGLDIERLPKQAEVLIDSIYCVLTNTPKIS